LETSLLKDWDTFYKNEEVLQAFSLSRLFSFIEMSNSEKGYSSMI